MDGKQGLNQLEFSFEERKIPKSAPISETDDLTLIGKIKDEACCSSFKCILERHTGIVIKMMFKYKRFIESNGLNFDEVLDEKQYLVYESVRSYDASKNTKFSTWLGNQVRYFCLNRVRKESRKISMPEEKLTFFLDNNDQEANINFDEIKELVLYLLSKLKDPRMKTVFNIRYFSGSRKAVPFKEIAKKMDVAPQTVVNLHNKAKIILSKKIRKNNCRTEVL